MKKATKPAARPKRAGAAPPGGGIDPSASKASAPQRIAPVVVAIGASAGGLEAVQLLLDAMPADTGMAFVHIQHLDPQRKSMMADLLQRSTRMRVLEAGDDTLIEPNCVYVGPSDRDVTIRAGRLHLVEPPEPHHLHLAIDAFFRSLAGDKGDKAIGIILSGTGTDGTLGLRAIKGAGGMTIAQDPKTAKYDGMPHSAIGTHLVDFVLPPQEIPAILVDYVRQAYVTLPDAMVAPTAAGQVEQIHTLLRDQTGRDFSHYKQNTIRRRIERRMAVHQIKRFEEYVRHLQRFPSEVDALFKDLLIGVTNFFRDPEAFRALEEKVVPALIAHGEANGQIRVWVPACSTGEEAYSIAMVIADHLESTRRTSKVTIFATDIDTAAIDAARTGLYPDSIAADVPAERLARLFTKEGGAYRIAKRIRETVIFAVQDVLRDPPFSKIDLISCRNLLIYLESDLQRRLMQLFHAVLVPGGYLSLGVSETVGDAGDLFAPVDKKWKIFETRAVGTHPLLGVTALNRLNDAGGALPPRAPEPPEATPSLGLGAVTAKLLMDRYAPPAVVVDERYDIIYFQGRTGTYLDLPTGEPHLNLLSMARGELLRELRTALHRVHKERGEIVRDRLSLTGADGTVRHLRLRVQPFRGPLPGQHLFLVAFESVAPPATTGEGAPDGAPPAEDANLAELRHKLTSMNESLQSSVEEVETSNEELRSTNEELQSANEELQSTNEEMETSKEELQSVNEELMTVNSEFQKKLEELSQANNDLTNLLNSTDIGTVFLGNDLRIKRFTPSIAKLMNLIPGDVGRPVADIVTQLIDDDLVAHASEVLRTLALREAEVRTKGGRSYLRRILPYRTLDNVIDGVVVTFVNITDLRDAQRMVEATLTYANSIVNAVRHPVVLLSKGGRIVQVNQAFYDMFHTRREDTLGTRLYDLDGARWNQPDLRRELDSVLAGGPPLENFEADLDLPRLGRRPLRLYASRSTFGTKAVAGEEELTLLTIEDGGSIAPSIASSIATTNGHDGQLLAPDADGRKS